jgi:hypothetical protein
MVAAGGVSSDLANVLSCLSGLRLLGKAASVSFWLSERLFAFCRAGERGCVTGGQNSRYYVGKAYTGRGRQGVYI